MNIKDRFEKLVPNSKVYWNGNTNQLSIHIIDRPEVTKDQVERIVGLELDKIGLLRAIDSLRILSY